MKLLILGGTRFLGRALVEAALARGHQITLFNRGQANPGLFPQAEQLTGDRSGDLRPLAGRQWDGVIDTSGYEPAVVARAAKLLGPAVAHYTFISSLSVYADVSQPGTDETAPVATLPPGADETLTNETYGALKALCEQAIERLLPGRVLNLRPGLIVGEYDPSDRFTYWPWRIQQGGAVLAPGRPAQPTQFIDVRDLADWTLRLVEQGQTGVYNATGPQGRLTLGELLAACSQVCAGSARLTWVREDFLLANGVQPWVELPLWLPASDPATAGFNRVEIRKAIQARLTFRPLADTLRSTLAWANRRPAGYEWRAGLPSAREAELLQRAQAEGGLA